MFIRCKYLLLDQQLRWIGLPLVSHAFPFPGKRKRKRKNYFKGFIFKGLWDNVKILLHIFKKHYFDKLKKLMRNISLGEIWCWMAKNLITKTLVE